MVIIANSKDQKVEFIPENKFDSFRLGCVFGDRAHRLKFNSNNQDTYEEIRLSVGVWELWRMLNDDSKGD